MVRALFSVARCHQPAVSRMIILQTSLLILVANPSVLFYFRIENEMKKSCKVSKLPITNWAIEHHLKTVGDLVVSLASFILIFIFNDKCIMNEISIIFENLL